MFNKKCKEKLFKVYTHKYNMTYEETIIKGILIFLGSITYIGIIYKTFFNQKIVIIEPTPKKVVVERR